MIMLIGIAPPPPTPRHAQLCDVILDVAGETINAHKLILASVSPYFYAMFNGKRA